MKSLAKSTWIKKEIPAEFHVVSNKPLLKQNILAKYTLVVLVIKSWSVVKSQTILKLLEQSQIDMCFFSVV